MTSLIEAGANLQGFTLLTPLDHGHMDNTMRRRMTPLLRTPGTILLFVATLAALPACATRTPTPSQPPTPIDFSQALEYARRSALVYETDSTIRLQSPQGATVSIMPQTPAGVKAHLETDDAKRVQWLAVRGTSNLANVKLDVDYNKVVDSRLQVPLHKGFADAAL